MAMGRRLNHLTTSPKAATVCDDLQSHRLRASEAFSADRHVQMQTLSAVNTILRVSRLLFSARFPAFIFLKQLLGGGVNSSAEFFASGKALFSFFNPPLHQQSQPAISPRSRQSRIQFPRLLEFR